MPAALVTLVTGVPGVPGDPGVLFPWQKLAWEQQEAAERKLNFVPQRFGSLRQVPAYPRFIQERFERCLDLYLCPRQRKMRVRSSPPTTPRPGHAGELSHTFLISLPHQSQLLSLDEATTASSSSALRFSSSSELPAWADWPHPALGLWHAGGRVVEPGCVSAPPSHRST